MNETDDLKILIVADEDTFLDATTTSFRKKGFHCHGVVDIQSALSELEEKRYDLLISDINMDGNKNLEFLQDIKTQQPELPIIVVTGYPSLETAITSLRLKVADYFQKPLDFQTLLESANRSISSHRFSQRLRHVQGELSAWQSDVKGLEQEVAYYHDSQHLESSRQNLLMGTLFRFGGMLTGLRGVLMAMNGQTIQQPSDLCALLKCPRPDASRDLRQAIVEAIQVLEKTKRAFKSKDLAELRTRLESTLLRKDITV